MANRSRPRAHVHVPAATRWQSAATATLAAAEAAAADDGLSEGIIRIKLIEYHGKAGYDAMGKNAIKNAKERRQGRHPELSAAGPWSLHLDSLGHYSRHSSEHWG